MRLLIGALLLTGGVLATTAAYAQSPVVEKPDCSGTLTTGIERGYVYPNYGIDVAPGAAVARAAVALTCGHLTASWQGTSELSTDDTYGHRGLADEQRVGLTYHHQAGTPLGTFTYAISVTYLGLDMGQGVGVSRDDYVELTAKVARPTTYGRWTLTPYVEAVKDIPVGHNNPLYWFTVGSRVETGVTEHAQLYVDVVAVHNINSTTAVPHKNVWYGETALVSELGPRLSATMGFVFTQYGKRDSRSFLDVQPDGRLVQKPRTGPKPVRQPNLNPFLRLTYTF